ncbi:pro-neuregulin-4, membrane-bound isoform isoform X3 [Sciurus carolinensis]|uniref:pro-neuregulin-4, membrane-bound isoform isoform X3 n=1 Tax=Sciurus carolinensis TaxID=30640 RepID=UPI001FB4346B|nr:pro-neuregulin-4, membrane-bound isoform isoform X3 [Sciurus carolinensis]
MPTDHEEPCGPSYRSFCLNGGICYVIPTIPSPFCRCVENYTGARCEEVFLPSSSIQSKSNLFAAFLALTVLLVTLTVAALYFLCRSWRPLKKHQSELYLCFYFTKAENETPEGRLESHLIQQLQQANMAATSLLILDAKLSSPEMTC